MLPSILVNNGLPELHLSFSDHGIGSKQIASIKYGSSLLTISDN